MSVSVVLKSKDGVWCPQTHLYFSQSSKVLLSRSPTEVTEEVLYVYCPQCFIKFTEDEAFDFQSRCPTCMQCPNCTVGVLTSIDASTLFCDNCQHKTPHTSRPDMISTKKYKNPNYAILLQKLKEMSTTNLLVKPQQQRRGGTKDSTAAFGTPREKRWQLEDLEKKMKQQLETPLELDLLSPSSIEAVATSSSSFHLQGVPLKSKRTVRSCMDIDANRFNILVQPKPHPLDGDSSTKVSTGDWWEKDCSAIHTLPYLSIVTLPTTPMVVDVTDNNGQWTEIKVKFRNPRVAPMKITLLSSTTIEPTTITNSDPASSSSSSDGRKYVMVNPLGEMIVCPSSSFLVCRSASLPSPLILNLEAYEDELFKDDDDDGNNEEGKTKVERAADEQPSEGDGSTDTAGATTQEGKNDDQVEPSWKMHSQGNLGCVTIPIHRLSLESFIQTKVCELALSYQVECKDLQLVVQAKILLKLF